tara:strand:+ start:611 stop:1792 length:1182 start_codon:yes stop_codon:yes gene_type:complete
MVFHNILAGSSGQALSGDGLWVWGKNNEGQLGLGDTTNRSSPTQLGEDTDWERVSTNVSRNMGCVKEDGTLWTWGHNQYGQLGHGNTTNLSSPVQVGSDTNWHSIYSFGGGGSTMLALKTTGAIYTCGSNSGGQLGQGASSNLSSFTQVGSLTNWLNSNYDDDTYADGYPATVAAGNLSWWAIKSDNTLWSCGFNNFGQLGLGDTTNRSSPTQVGSLTDWAYLPVGAGEGNGCCAVKTDGTLWSWGNNSAGQLGVGDTTKRSSPVQVGSLTNYKVITKGTNTMMFTNTSNQLWVVGLGDNGGLGTGNTTSVSSPVQVGSDTDWHNIIGGAYTGMATRSDGSLWVWGRNNEGQLGDDTTTNTSSPNQVGSATDWSTISIGAGYDGMMARIRKAP